MAYLRKYEDEEWSKPPKILSEARGAKPWGCGSPGARGKRRCGGVGRYTHRLQAVILRIDICRTATAASATAGARLQRAEQGSHQLLTRRQYSLPLRS